MAKKGLASSLNGTWSQGVNRNKFDISRTNRLTTRVGRVTPTLIRSVSPNEHYTINESSGFDFRFPLVGTFPPHYRYRSRYFYVRMRTLWANWKQFIMQDPLIKSTAIAPPLVDDLSSPLLQTGSLGDYLNLPTVVTSTQYITAHSKTWLPDEFWKNQVIDGSVTHGRNYWCIKQDSKFYYPQNPETTSLPSSQHDFTGLEGHVGLGAIPFQRDALHGYEPCFKSLEYMEQVCPYLLDTHQTDRGSEVLVQSDELGTSFWGMTTFFQGLPMNISPIPTSSLSLPFQTWEIPYIASSYYNDKYNIWNDFENFTCYLCFYQGSSVFDAKPTDLILQLDGKAFGQVPSSSNLGIITPHVDYGTMPYFTVNNMNASSARKVRIMDFKIPMDFINKLRSAQLQGTLFPVICYNQLSTISTSSSDSSRFSVHGFAAGSAITSNSTGQFSVRGGFCNCIHYPAIGETVNNSTFPSDLSVLPFRALEAVWNSHFRHPIIDPFKIDDVIAVDRYCTFMGDGKTEGEMQFYLDNSPNKDGWYLSRYPDDLLTTMIESPTMSDVKRPLIPMTIVDSEHAVLHYEDGTLDVTTTSDGHLTGISAHSLPADSKTVLTLKDAINYGIDLRDLADYKAITAWYEAQYRNGRFSYDDFIDAHFGKYPSHRDNLKPVFLGGFDTDLDTSKVVNTSSSSENSPLGTMTAIGSFNCGKQKPIQVDTDEEGFIIGVCWFELDPTYIQMIDPLWTRALPSDFRIQEFANLGVQPVYAKDVAPLQCDWSIEDPTDSRCPYHIVGYNRQYAQHIFGHDEMHGDYRTDALLPEVSLRLFDDPPESDPSLIYLNYKHLTNMFMTDKDVDTIKGAIHQDISVSTWLNQSPNATIL